MKTIEITKVTPLLIVDAIEPELPFWTKGLGYEKQAEAPHGDRLGFVLLSRPGRGEVMLQTKASVRDDLPVLLERKASSVLYVDVGSLDAALAATKGAPVLVEPRTTFYGMREAVVEDPQGQVIVFGEKV
jgi:uncharacterized glyoxalase superfamily protein PhnB